MAAIFIMQQNHDSFSPLRAFNSTLLLLSCGCSPCNLYPAPPFYFTVVHLSCQWSALLLPCLLPRCHAYLTGVLQRVQSLAAAVHKAFHKHLSLYSPRRRGGGELLSSLPDPCCAELVRFLAWMPNIISVHIHITIHYESWLTEISVVN